jgi:outer membrane protein assembly factor BamE (lipoprotein component of BamABCDE complex)
MITKRYFYLVVVFGILSLMVSACAYKSIKQGAPVTEERVAKNIIDGKTTKPEVLLEFGSPTKTMDNEKMFFYEWTEGSASKVGWYGGTSTNTYQLIILFDDQSIVKNHKISQTAAGSQSGIGETKKP